MRLTNLDRDLEMVPFHPNVLTVQGVLVVLTPSTQFPFHQRNGLLPQKPPGVSETLGLRYCSWVPDSRVTPRKHIYVRLPRKGSHTPRGSSRSNPVQDPRCLCDWVSRVKRTLVKQKQGREFFGKEETDSSDLSREQNVCLSTKFLFGDQPERLTRVGTCI